MTDEPQSDDVQPTPDARSVFDYLLYGVSLPERALRSTSAMVGGAMQESVSLLVPQAFKSSKSYTLFVQQMLDFVANDIGGVERPQSAGPSTTEVEGYVARKTVSTFIDLAGLATLHLSPMTILAVLSDVAYGSQEYLQELSEELKKQGVIAPDSTIDNAANLLDAIKRTAGDSAEAFDLPPLSVDGLAETIQQTRDKVAEVDPTLLMPQAEIKRMWNDMHAIASKEHVSVMSVASTMSLYSLNKVSDVGVGALSTVTVAGNLFDRHILDHYKEGISNIQEKGLYSTLSESSRPYIAAVWKNFSSHRSTITEDLLNGTLMGQVWSGMQTWWQAPAESDSNEEEEDAANGANGASQAEQSASQPESSDDNAAH